MVLHYNRPKMCIVETNFMKKKNRVLIKTFAGENPAAENQNQNQNLDQPMENQDPPAANENQREPEGGNGFNWWGIVKEIQLFVVGFVASLLPGYHNND